KVLRPSGEPAGLNLTRAVLDAACKYPWPRRSDTAKFGYYAEDQAAFEWLRAGAPAGRRCIEAQVMDWADDVAYSVHDVEDGIHSGLIRFGDVPEDDRARLCKIAAELYSPLRADDLAAVLDRLLAMPTLLELADYDGSYRAQAAAKRATSELTGRFAGAAVEATREVYGGGPLVRFGAELVVPDDVAAECALLKALAVHYVMRRSGIAERQAGQRQLLTELVEAVAESAPVTLDPDLQPAWRAADSDAGRLRVIIDQVAQLTDTSAVDRHAELVATRT
ncbi:MAG: dGTPase, partial [Pseudonocardiales bacterium]|nr:dGTPase [Pseudonocardiales bacterium]